MTIDITNLITEILFTEGAGTTAADSIGNANLTVDLDGTGSWVSDSGNGISFPNTTHEGYAGVSAPLTTNASDLASGLGSACQTMTVIFVVKDLLGTASLHRIFQMGSIGSNGDFAAVVNTEGVLSRVRVGYDTATALEPMYNADVSSGQHVVGISVDTREAAIPDRIKVYIDGSFVANTGSVAPGAQNMTLDFTDADTGFHLMNRGNYTRGTQGGMFACAVFSDLVSAAQHAEIATHWLANNDASLSPSTGITVTPETGSFGLNSTEPVVSHLPAAATVTPDATATLALASTEPVVSTGPASITVTAQTATLALASTEPVVSHVPAAVTVTPHSTSTFGLNSTEPVVSLGAIAVILNLPTSIPNTTGSTVGCTTTSLDGLVYIAVRDDIEWKSVAGGYTQLEEDADIQAVINAVIGGSIVHADNFALTDLTPEDIISGLDPVSGPYYVGWVQDVDA